MRAHAFKSQMWFLAQKFRMHQASRSSMKRSRSDDQEDAEIFAAGLKTAGSSGRGIGLYREFYGGSNGRSAAGVCSACTPVRVRRRIRQRGRSEEQAIRRYIRQLSDRYDRFIERWSVVPCVIDTSQLRYLDDLWDRRMLRWSLIT